ncbi:ABC transporter permease [Pseudoclavibacter sp. VKM Ac-2888]|uniref:ABC transporter permease n=1 Tax=Pseudoclavibacter sp. VKM Ac-2888 TaxID=2783830 RepID=UPI00188BCAE5|nr:FtsX-like permease family protein [Pseudoclavibacter sp. VKM Ac-2888]MBF4549482.1 FtsX-like permease family protein [Pseudoclavibacter sp. VKM Ac-2888]
MNSFRDYTSSILVAAVGALFGAMMLIASSVFTGYLEAIGMSDIPTVSAILNVIGYVFFGLALYVSAIVTANTCSTIVAGRARQIALLRLIGASSQSLRRQMARIGLLVGGVGALIGMSLALGLGSIAVSILRSNGTLPQGTYSILSVTLLVPAAAVILTTWVAFHVGSRPILNVKPLEALSSSVEQRQEDARDGLARTVIALLLLVAGLAVLTTGVMISETSTYAVLITMAGGFIAFTGVTIGAALYVPPILALLGHVGARNPAVLLSGRNALRAPGRTSRATMGLAIGATLLMTFTVGLATYTGPVQSGFVFPPGAEEQAAQILGTVSTVATSLSAFSAVIAAIGVVNALALGAVQRHREIGLLRAIGFTGAQVRLMIVVEAAQMVTAGLLIGVVFGTLFGWAGVVSLFGSQVESPIYPVVPLPQLGLLVLGAVVLAVIASLAPTARATRIAPTEALAVA